MMLHSWRKDQSPTPPPKNICQNNYFKIYIYLWVFLSVKSVIHLLLHLLCQHLLQFDLKKMQRLEG